MQNPNFIEAIQNAVRGLVYFFKNEKNGKIQLAIGFFTIVIAAYLGCNAIEWFCILFCIAMVLGFEMLNTAIEKTCDLIQEEYHPKIKIIKDVAAGAVLFVSIISAVIGGFIFANKIF
jgi:diacylglycerol kinase